MCCIALGCCFFCNFFSLFCFVLFDIPMLRFLPPPLLWKRDICKSGIALQVSFLPFLHYGFRRCVPVQALRDVSCLLLWCQLPYQATSCCLHFLSLHFFPAPNMGCRISQVVPTTKLSWPSRATSHFLSLPADIYRCIADFTGSRALSYVCHKTWSLLQHYNLSCHANGAMGLLKVLGLGPVGLGPETHSLTVTCGENNPVAHRVLPWNRLCHLASLAHLRLQLQRNFLECRHMTALSALGSSRSLTHLDVDLQGNSVGDWGAQAIAKISAAPRLTAVTLNLQNNFVGDEGAMALAAFKDTPLLRTLDLNLQNNRVQEAGVERLAAIHSARALQSLTLDLSTNNFGDPGAQALVALHTMPCLTTLSLSLKCNLLMTDTCLATLCRSLLQCSLLRSLSLGLGATNFGTSDGMVALLGLKPPHLTHFHLDLEFVSLWTDSRFCFRPIAGLRDMHNLTRLSLNLRTAFDSERAVDHAEMMRLASLARLPALTAVNLDLGQNTLTNHAVHCLADFGGMTTLQTFHVRLDGCKLGRGSAYALAYLRWGRALSDVSIDLRWNRLHNDDLFSLARLGEAPSLTSLRLQLVSSMFDITSAGMQSLGQLQHCPTLTSLDLDISQQDKFPYQVPKLQGLAGLFKACAITSLALGVGQFHANSVADLTAAMGCATALKCLSLGMYNSAVRDPHVEELLAKLRQLGSLQSLVLDLRSNHVGPRGAGALAMLRLAPALKSLTLDLQRNCLGDEGARALAALAESQRLTALSLCIGANEIEAAGMRALSALLENPALTNLQLSPRPEHNYEHKGPPPRFSLVFPAVPDTAP